MWILETLDFVNFKPTTTSEGFAAPPPPNLSTSIRNSTDYYSWLNENILTYNTEFGDHKINILAGFTAQRYRMDFSQIRLTDFSDDRIETIQSAANVDRAQPQVYLHLKLVTIFRNGVCCRIWLV